MKTLIDKRIGINSTMSFFHPVKKQGKHIQDE